MLEKVYNTITLSLIFSFVEITFYQLLEQMEKNKYWVIIPICLFLVLRIYEKYAIKSRVVAIMIGIASLIALFVLFICVCNNGAKAIIYGAYVYLSLAVGVMLFAGVFIWCIDAEDVNRDESAEQDQRLFNLFYLNTSKTHEIAMLIDNKIMKTIEHEQTSEKILKHGISGSIGSEDVVSGKAGYSIEDNSKKRVYENFDVKNTKSIMLRKIYDTAVKSKNSELKEGDLTIFENVELRQRNVDDTVMILNILQDSKMKNQGNDSIEINLNKMIEKMLEDFTIDYTFDCSRGKQLERKYIIQLPYNSMDNFENGYQHNDLQLGKLSIVGIYRGEIDFTERKSISSRFLELMEASIDNEKSVKQAESIMKLSYAENVVGKEMEFDLKHQQLTGKYSLIDVIAIIQEINISDR